MNERISPQDIVMSDAMPYQQHWEARIVGTAETLGTALTPELFLSNRDRLRAGDQVSICAFESRNWDVLTAIVTVRVVFVEQHAVEIMPTSEVIAVERHDPEISEPTEDANRFYVRGVGGGSFAVYDKNARQGKSQGRALDTFKDKAAAEAYANELNGAREAA